MLDTAGNQDDHERLAARPDDPRLTRPEAAPTRSPESTQEIPIPVPPAAPPNGAPQRPAEDFVTQGVGWAGSGIEIFTWTATAVGGGPVSNTVYDALRKAANRIGSKLRPLGRQPKRKTAGPPPPDGVADIITAALAVARARQPEPGHHEHIHAELSTSDEATTVLLTFDDKQYEIYLPVGGKHVMYTVKTRDR